MPTYKVSEFKTGRNPRKYKTGSRRQAAIMWLNEEDSINGACQASVAVEFVLTGVVTNHHVEEIVKYIVTDILS